SVARGDRLVHGDLLVRGHLAAAAGATAGGGAGVGHGGPGGGQRDLALEHPAAVVGQAQVVVGGAGGAVLVEGEQPRAGGDGGLGGGGVQDLVALAVLVEHGDVDALRADAHHVVELAPHEVAVRALAGGEVAGQNTGLVVEAVAVAVGLVADVDVGVEVVRVRDRADPAHHPRRDHVEGVGWS